jgi:hypothetical protein
VHVVEAASLIFERLVRAALADVAAGAYSVRCSRVAVCLLAGLSICLPACLLVCARLTGKEASRIL